MAASVVLHLAAIVLTIETSGPDIACGQDATEVAVILSEAAIAMPNVPQPDRPAFATRAAVPDDTPAPVEPSTEPQDSKVRDNAVAADIVLPTPAEPDQRPAVIQLAAAPAEAPQVVQDESRAALSDACRSKVARHLSRFKRCLPGATSGRARLGKVLMTFDLPPDGPVAHAAFIQSSGNPAFDAEAEAMIRRAQPSPVHDRAEKSRLSSVVPVSYRPWI